MAFSQKDYEDMQRQIAELQKALGVRTHKHPAQAASDASQAWRPWRSYAAVRAWSADPGPNHPQKLSGNSP